MRCLRRDAGNAFSETNEPALDALRADGVRIVMASGDALATAGAEAAPDPGAPRSRQSLHSKSPMGDCVFH